MKSHKKAKTILAPQLMPGTALLGVYSDRPDQRRGWQEALPHRPLRRRSASLAFGLALALTVNWASAHAASVHHITLGWLRWQFAPAIVGPIALACVVYAVGAVRQMTAGGYGCTACHVTFGGGIASLCLALVSPIDAMASHLYYMQQIQTMLLRMVAPTLIVLSNPWATMIAGLPRGRCQTAATGFLNGVRSWGALKPLAHPAVVTFLFVAVFAFWQIPPFLSDAVLNARTADLMQASMLVTGWLFCWRALDSRSPPDGPSYGARLAMLFPATLPQIGLGAYITVKTEVLYPVYDTVGRLFHMSALADETIGGSIIWVPGSIACVLAVIVILHLWAKHEERLDARRRTWTGSNSDALLFPTTAAALIEIARPKNRILAFGAAAIALAMFVLVMITGVLNHLNNTMASRGASSEYTLFRK